MWTFSQTRLYVLINCRLNNMVNLRHVIHTKWIMDVSFPGTKRPHSERSFPGTKLPSNFRTVHLQRTKCRKRELHDGNKLEMIFADRKL